MAVERHHTHPPVYRNEPRLFIWCLGGFRIEVDGAQVDTSSVRPRSRTLLRLLASRAGQPAHRETLVDALWPATPIGPGLHSLHVAVSSLRGLLRARTGLELIHRVGDAYALRLPADAGCDLTLFQTALRMADRCRRTRDQAGLIAALRAAAESYRGDLLPEDGPAEWVVGERSRLRHRATEALAELGAAELADGRAEQAVAAATRCLELDGYCDPAWRLLIEANRRRGDMMGEARARRRYLETLARLEA